MPVIAIEEVFEWDSLFQFARDLDDRGHTHNLAHLCHEYKLGKPEDITDEQFNRLPDLTECDTDAIAKIIDKYWSGTYIVEYVDDKNMGFIKASKIPDYEEECEVDEDREPRYNEGFD